jgi:hypothetical protein
VADSSSRKLTPPSRNQSNVFAITQALLDAASKLSGADSDIFMRRFRMYRSKGIHSFGLKLLGKRLVHRRLLNSMIDIVARHRGCTRSIRHAVDVNFVVESIWPRLSIRTEILLLV